MKVWDKAGRVPGPQRIITVMWLSFLTAGMATGAFFTVVDPVELGSCISLPELSRTGAYSIGFFLFWLLTAVTGLLAVHFTYPAEADKHRTQKK